MKKILLITLFLLLSSVVLVIYSLSATEGTNDQVNVEKAENKLNCYQETCFGVAGYTPIGFPTQSISSNNEFWTDISTLDIYGVHTEATETAVLEQAASYTNVQLILLISHDDIYNLEQIFKILEENSQISFLGIGNEINLLYETEPEEYQEFLETSSINLPKIRSEFPDIELFTVFQYESLLGNAYLMGGERDSSIAILSDWEPLVDLLGFTVYPYLDHMHPDELPDEYFDPILTTVKKPIAITETSWPSEVDVFTGENVGFNTDEIEQTLYAEWIRSVSLQNNFVFTNWLFLNDIPIDQPLFKGSGLRNYESVEKPAYSIWIR